MKELMPHVSIKLYPGRSEEQKTQLTEAIGRALLAHTNCREDSISIAIEEIPPAEWGDVYKADIADKWDKLYRKPGYEPPR